MERSNLTLAPNVIISAYDFGAQDIYEIEYPIFLRNQNAIALIVVDANEYMPESHDKLVTRWLSNCVLCGECEVVFVLSKCDKLELETVNSKYYSLHENVSSHINKEIDFLEHEAFTLKNSKSKEGQYSSEKIKAEY